MWEEKVHCSVFINLCDNHIDANHCAYSKSVRINHKKTLHTNITSNYISQILPAQLITVWNE